MSLLLFIPVAPAWLQESEKQFYTARHERRQWGRRGQRVCGESEGVIHSILKWITNELFHLVPLTTCTSAFTASRIYLLNTWIHPLTDCFLIKRQHVEATKMMRLKVSHRCQASRWTSHRHTSSSLNYADKAGENLVLCGYMVQYSTHDWLTDCSCVCVSKVKPRERLKRRWKWSKRQTTLSACPSYSLTIDAPN